MRKVKQFIFMLLLMGVAGSGLYAQSAPKKVVHKKKVVSGKKKVKKKTTALKMPKEIHWYTAGGEVDFEKEAKKEKKPSFLYIYLDNGDVCPAFNKQVLRDTNIVNFVDSNFLAYRLNLEYDSPNAMKFMIDDVPTVILFDRNAQEIDRFTGMVGVQEFKKFLQKDLKK